MVAPADTPVVNCPNCGAPMRPEDDGAAMACEYCGYFHLPDPDLDGIRVLGDPGEYDCPVCHIRLVHATLGAERLLCCGRCRGMLIEVGRFLPVIETLRASIQASSAVLPLNPEDLRRNVLCPVCHKPMDTHPYGGPGAVVIDNCPDCEVNWLDHSELRRIAAAPSDPFERVFEREDLPFPPNFPQDFR